MLSRKNSKRVHNIPIAKAMAYAELPYQEARIRSQQRGMYGEAKDFTKMADEAAKRASEAYLMKAIGAIVAEDIANFEQVLKDWSPPLEGPEA